MLSLGPYTAGPEFAVNNTAGPSVYPKVNRIASGVLVTWSEAEAPDGNRNVFGRRFDDWGRPLGEKFRINTHLPSAQSRSDAAELPDGFVVVWDSDGQDGSQDAVIGRIFSTEEEPQTPEFIVNTQTQGHQNWPRVVPLPNGFVVGFNSGDSSRWEFYAQLFHNNGSKIGGEISLAETGPQNHFLTGLARTSLGFVAVWLDSGRDGSHHGSYGRLFSQNGTALTDVFQANTYTLGPQGYPVVTGLPNGFVVVWHSNDQDGSEWGVFGQRFDERGKRAGSEFRANSYRIYTQYDPRVVTLNSLFAIAWQSQSDDPDGDLYVRLFNFTGHPLGPEALVTDRTEGKQNSQNLAATLKGFVMTWAHQDKNSKDYEVLGRAFTLPSTTTQAITTPTALLTSTSSATTMALLTHTSTAGASRLFASPSASSSLVPILVTVIAALALSLCSMLGLYIHQRRKQVPNVAPEGTAGEEISQYGTLTLAVSEDGGSRYQTSLPVQKQSTPADYDSFRVVEEENAKY